jgi:DNA-binding GntR family transcriptional regulator
MSDDSPKLGLTKRRVLADEVTDDIRQAIIRHELEPTRKLAEDQLAAQLGVSRGPVREAIMRLEREGLVTVERHRGATVASWSRKDIDEIYSLRSVLEKLAIELACKNATPIDIDRMEEVLKEYSELSESSRTPQELSRLDVLFHTALFMASHHERLIKTWEILCSQIRTFLVYTWSDDDEVNKGYLPSWKPDHAEMVEIIRSGDTSKATKLVHTHVKRAYERVALHFPEPSVKVSKKKA